MLATNTTHIHGLHTAWANDGLEVRYVFPGALATRDAPAPPDAATERVMTLGVMTADPDGPDRMHVRDDRVWRWEAKIEPATRIWARHVLAADIMGRSFSYDHEGQIVLVWTNLPALELEIELLREGFTPALATWRAPDTTAARALASRMEQVPPRPAPRVLSGLMPAALHDASDHAARAEHAWMRWSARTDNRFLKVGDQVFQYQRRPERDGSRLILRYVSSTAALQMELDVARHPLIYDVTVVVEKRDGRVERTFPAVAWEDFDNLVVEIAKIADGTPAFQPSARPSAPDLASASEALPVAPTSPELRPRAGETAYRWLTNKLEVDLRKGVSIRGTPYHSPVVERRGDALVIEYQAEGGRRLVLWAAPLAGYAGRPNDGSVDVRGELRNGEAVVASFPWRVVERRDLADLSDVTAASWFGGPVSPPRALFGEEMEGPYRRAEIWESVIASILVDLDLPGSVLLYPLVHRLTQAALTTADEQAVIHGADYLESLRRPGPTQVARLAQLEQRLFDTLAEAEAFGGLATLVRQVVGLADGSIRRVPAGTASELFFRTWTPPATLKVRGRVFDLRANHVLFETSTVELRYATEITPGLSTPRLTLIVGMPDRRGLCEIQGHLWYADGGEKAEPWKVTIPQLEKLTGTAIMKQLRPVARTTAASRAQDAADAWDDILVAEFNARSGGSPQIRLDRRLGSGSRIFVAFIAGSRPEEIVARITINAALKIESFVLSAENAALQASLRRRLDEALAITGQRVQDDDEAEEPSYVAARKKALPEPPRPALVDRLARHMAGEREAAALQELRAQARTDLSAAARTVEAMAGPEGPSPGETAEWFDEHRLPKSAALLSSYIYAPTVDLDSFMVDLSESLDHEMGVEPAMLVAKDILELPRGALREKDGRTYVLEAAGSSMHPHTVVVIDADEDFARIDAGKLVPGMLRRGAGYLYLGGAFFEEAITQVRDRFHALLQGLRQAPVQIEDMRQLIVLAAELVDAPRCQGVARANALRALEAARNRYADARMQLARGRDARALDRLREALRAVVEVAHNSAESCAAGQTALPGFAEGPTDRPVM